MKWRSSLNSRADTSTGSPARVTSIFRKSTATSPKRYVSPPGCAADGARRPLSSTAVHIHGALVRRDNVPHHAEADAGATDLRVDCAASAEERIEDVRQVGGVDPDASIGDRDRDTAAVRARGDVHAAA